VCIHLAWDCCVGLEGVVFWVSVVVIGFVVVGLSGSFMIAF